MKQKNSNAENLNSTSSVTVRENPQALAGQQQGDKRIGNYLVGKTIGQGTFGKVRVGTHVLTDEKVAIKILEKDKIKDQADITRVMREIQILKIVRHPNIVQLYEIIETSRQLFLIMEFVPGGELFNYIVKKKRLQDKEACRFFHQILSGVEYLHSIKICHRDLKPENLLLDENMNIKIVDFGLSNTYKQSSDQLKTACGSPCYASPEMIAGKKYYGLDTDLWSLGVITYAMTVGYLPFEDPDTNKLYKKILSLDYIVPGYVEKPCKDMIKNLLMADPTLRFKIEDVKVHNWYNQINSVKLNGIEVGKDQIPVLSQIQHEIEKTAQYNSLEGINDLPTMIKNNKHNPLTATYYLLIKRFERNTDQNLVFGKFTRDKRFVTEQLQVSNSSSVRAVNQPIQSILPKKTQAPNTTQSYPPMTSDVNNLTQEFTGASPAANSIVIQRKIDGATTSHSNYKRSVTGPVQNQPGITQSNGWMIQNGEISKQTKYQSQPPAQRSQNFQYNMMKQIQSNYLPSQNSQTLMAERPLVQSQQRNIAIRLDQKGKQVVTAVIAEGGRESQKNSSHNLYDLSDNKQRIKTQTTVGRRRANYSQENLPSVEQNIVQNLVLKNKKPKIMKSYITNNQSKQQYETGFEAATTTNGFIVTNFQNQNSNYIPAKREIPTKKMLQKVNIGRGGINFYGDDITEETYHSKMNVTQNNFKNIKFEQSLQIPRKVESRDSALINGPNKIDSKPIHIQKTTFDQPTSSNQRLYNSVIHQGAHHMHNKSDYSMDLIAKIASKKGQTSSVGQISVNKKNVHVVVAQEKASQKIFRQTFGQFQVPKQSGLRFPTNELQSVQQEHIYKSRGSSQVSNRDLF